MYFIWYYALMTMIDFSIIHALSGFIIGHLYITFKEILPVSHRLYYLDTPRIFNLAADKFLKLMNYKRNLNNQPVNNNGGNNERNNNRN